MSISGAEIPFSQAGPHITDGWRMQTQNITKKVVFFGSTSRRMILPEDPQVIKTDGRFESQTCVSFVFGSMCRSLGDQWRRYIWQGMRGPKFRDEISQCGPRCWRQMCVHGTPGDSFSCTPFPRNRLASANMQIPHMANVVLVVFCFERLKSSLLFLWLTRQLLKAVFFLF